MCIRPVDEANEFRNDKLKNKQGMRAVAKAHAKVKQTKRLSVFFLVLCVLIAQKLYFFHDSSDKKKIKDRVKKHTKLMER